MEVMGGGGGCACLGDDLHPAALYSGTEWVAREPRVTQGAVGSMLFHGPCRTGVHPPSSAPELLGSWGGGGVGEAVSRGQRHLQWGGVPPCQGPIYIGPADSARGSSAQRSQNLVASPSVERSGLAPGWNAQCGVVLWGVVRCGVVLCGAQRCGVVCWAVLCYAVR